MRQANGHSGEVRESNLVSLSNYPKHPKKTWEGKRHVYGMFAWTGEAVYRCRKIWPDLQIASSRLRTSGSAFLVETGKWETGTQHDKPPMRDSTSADCRSGSHVGCLDSIYPSQGVGWINLAAIFGGNWNNAANSGSRASNWNNYPWNSNNNIGARGVCDGKFLSLSRVAKALLADQYLWSADLSSFGKYIAGFGTAFGSVKRRLQPVF